MSVMELTRTKNEQLIKIAGTGRASQLGWRIMSGVALPCVLRLLIVELRLLSKHDGLLIGTAISKSCFWNEVNLLKLSTISITYLTELT